MAVRVWSDWLASKGSPSDGTVQTYRRVFNEALPILATILRESGGVLGEAEVRAYADRLAHDPHHPKQPATVALHLSVLSSFWQHLQAKGYVRDNPWRLIRRRALKVTFAERLLTEEEVQRLIRAARPGRDQLLLRFLYLTGARVSEACQVRWKDISQQGGRMVVTLYGKGGKTRWVPLPMHLYEELRAYSGRSGDPEAPLFPTRYRSARNAARNGCLSPRTAQRIVERAAIRAGMARQYWDAEQRRIIVRWERRPSPHWLRHAHASHALAHGAPVHFVQHTLGHASLATTGAYLHAQAGQSSVEYLHDPGLQETSNPAQRRQ